MTQPDQLIYARDYAGVVRGPGHVQALYPIASGSSRPYFSPCLLEAGAALPPGDRAALVPRPPQPCMIKLSAMGGHRRSLSGRYPFLSHSKIRVELLVQLRFEHILGTFPTLDLTLVVDDTLVPK